MLSAGGGTPIGVWVIYALGLLAATVFVVSALLTAGAYLLSDIDVNLDISPLAIVVWGGLVALAAATWLWRRSRGHT